MIERFNFYDLYAYLVPGLAFIAALWIPFGIISWQWPSNDFVSAAGFILAGYVLGLLLHEMASSVPWTYLDPVPSDRMLDEKDEQLRPELRSLVLGRMVSLFGLAIAGKELRNPAFRIARTRLIHDRRGSYIEQFIGLYGMTRSLSLAALLSFAWYGGWVMYAVRAEVDGRLWTPDEIWSGGAVFFSGLGLVGLGLQLRAQASSIAATKVNPLTVRRLRAWARWLALSWLGVLFIAGVFAASRREVTWPHLSLLWVPSLGALSAWLIFWRASIAYAYSFANEVYHALIATPADEPRGQSPTEA